MQGLWQYDGWTHIPSRIKYLGFYLYMRKYICYQIFFDNLVIIQEKLSGLNIMAFILLIDICPLSRMIYIIIVWPSVPGLVGTSDLWIIVAFGHKQLRRTLAANRLPKWFKNVVASGHNRLWSPLEAKFRTSTMRWSLILNEY